MLGGEYLEIGRLAKIVFPSFGVRFIPIHGVTPGVYHGCYKKIYIFIPEYNGVCDTSKK